jgi:hypothetical protein
MTTQTIAPARLWPSSDHRWEIPARPSSNPDAAVYDMLVDVLHDIDLIAAQCPDGAATGWLALRTTVRDRIDVVAHAPTAPVQRSLTSGDRVRRTDVADVRGRITSTRTSGGVSYAVVRYDGGMNTAELPTALLERAS